MSNAPTVQGLRAKVFVVDSHAIYRRGLVASLMLLDGVGAVDHADAVDRAEDHVDLHDADVVIVDTGIPDGHELIASVAASGTAHVIACSSDCDAESVNAALEAGAGSYLHKDLLTQELLHAAIQAVMGGASIIAPRHIGTVAARAPVADDEPAAAANTRLTDREQRVLALIADGHPTREVATELCYSERTVKNILHDVVTKLNARSRSQAVAYAVRDGLI